MSDSSTEAYRLKAGPVGILLLHGFTASPTELRPLANVLYQAGYTVSGIRLAGHGTHIDELRKTSWPDWLNSAQQGLEELHETCEQVYIIGLSMGGVIATFCSWRPYSSLLYPQFPRDRKAWPITKSTASLPMMPCPYPP